MLSSIKTRIITFYMVVLFIVLSLLGAFLYLSLDEIVYNSIDSGLLSRAKALATLVNENDNETEFNFSDEVMWEYNSPKASVFFQIRRFDGTITEKSESLRGSDLPFQTGEKQMNFETILLNGVPARMVNFYIPYNGGTKGKETGKGIKSNRRGLIIQCAEDIDEQTELLQNYLIVLSLSILFVMIISASGGFLIAKKALTPIKEISETIDRISESNLSERVTMEEIPDELKPLASSFNRTFDSLERSFNRQRQFAADASHELRTPLSVILSQSEVMLRKERTAEEYKNALKAVGEAADMMSQIVRKLLTITRLGADKVELKIENIDPGEIISESVKLLTPLAEQKAVGINVSVPDRLVVRGDRAALLELFVNIIDNAIKYNLPQGRIDISVKKEKGFIITEIKDAGIGIPESDLGRVLDRFYRVDKSRSRDLLGVGLGLSICDEIVKLHGGRIDMKSRPGTGTLVSVHLKGAEDAAQA